MADNRFLSAAKIEEPYTRKQASSRQPGGMLLGFVFALTIGFGMRSPARAPFLVADLFASERVRIFQPRGVEGSLRMAAEDMARILEGAGEREVRLLEQPWWGAPKGLYLGATRYGRSVLPDDEIAGPELFTVREDDDRWVLRGGDDHSTGLGVYWLLKKLAEPRWFFPAEMGEVLATRKIALPIILSVPPRTAFDSSYFSWKSLDGEGIWRRRNLLNRRIPHNHNLHRIFPSDLVEEHPDWFPLVGGQRYDPREKAGQSWQPNLALSEVAEHAALRAAAYFEEHPEEVYYSLCINDSIRFDESELTRAVLEPLRFFRGKPDYSDLVFGFMNRAAEALEDRFPDRYLTAYAYFWCENTPMFPVHTKVVPVLTADRSQWYDALFRDEDMALMRRWSQQGPEKIVIYDYYYGAGFVIPRIFTALIDESIKYAYSLGVAGFYSEAYPIWGFDGPKLWMAAQLLRDPNLSRADLLEEYYISLFGSAAEPVGKFYEGCEAVWMNQPGPPRWIKYFRDEAQGLLFLPTVCEQLRAHLNEALRLADDENIRKRIELISEAFTMTELFSDMVHLRTDLAARHELSATELEDTLLDLATLTQSEARVREFQRHLQAAGGLNARLANSDWVFGSDPTLRLLMEGLDVADSLDDGGELSGRILDLANAIESKEAADLVRSYRRSLESHSPLVNEVRNPGFETAPEDSIAAPWRKSMRRHVSSGWLTKIRDWTVNLRPTETIGVAVSEESARSGKWGLALTNHEFSLIYQEVAVAPGNAYKFSGWVRARVGWATTVALDIAWQDADGADLDRVRQDRLRAGAETDWMRLAVLGRAPPGAAVARLTLRVNFQEPGDFLFADDFAFLELAGP